MLSLKSLPQKIRENPRKSYYFALFLCYAVGFVIYLTELMYGDVLRQLSFSLQAQWTTLSALAYGLTALLLFIKAPWGVVSLHVVAFAQLMALWGLPEFLGRHDVLVLFHIVSLTVFWKIFAREKRNYYEARAKEADKNSHPTGDDQSVV